MVPLNVSPAPRRRLCSERGAELVEIALVMPVLLLMLAGIFDVGFLLNHYTVATNAAREGARVAAVPGWTAVDVEARVSEYLSGGGLPVTGVVTTVNPVAVTAGSRTINAVRVTVSYPYNYVLLGSIAEWFDPNPASGATVTVAATMRMEVAAGL